MADDRTQILAILRAQEAANASGDAAGVFESVAEDGVAYALPPPLEQRGSAMRATEALNKWFATWKDGVRVEMADPTILIDGDLAVAFGLSRMQGEKRDRGPVDIWSRRTVVFNRRDSKWWIVHDHESYPMLMDGSDKAALDLKPE